MARLAGLAGLLVLVAVPWASAGPAVDTAPAGAAVGTGLPYLGEDAWPDGWWIQAPGVVVVSRIDRIEIPLTGFHFSLSQNVAHCDPFSAFNGIDGRWYRRPVASDGTPFETLSAFIGGGLLTARLIRFYQDDGSTCTFLGDGPGVGAVFPAGATHAFVLLAGISPHTNGGLPGVAPPIFVGSCHPSGCGVDPGEFSVYWNHPVGGPLSLVPGS